MPNFRETRARIAYAYRNSFINKWELVLLYELHKLKNPEFPYWNCERFDLDEKTNDECKAEFHFYREDIYKLAEQLQLPDEITTYNGLVVASVPALCMCLKRYAYPCRYGDLLYHFARPVAELSVITSHMMDLIYGWWHPLLTRYNHDLLSPPKLLQYAQVIEQAGAALDNCWGFVYRTVRLVCRPSENQRVIYNGHKRVHSIKFQAVALPNVLVGNLYMYVMYVTCALMRNARSILYGSATSEYFGLNPPTLEEYFIWSYVCKIHLYL